MIKHEDLIKIGKINKTHGIKGELSFSFTNDSFDESECSFLIIEFEGIWVPFVLEEYRFKSDTSAFIKLKKVDSDEKARVFVNREVYFPKEYIQEETLENTFGWNYFVGYTLEDEEFGFIGEIVEVDDSTLNILFIVKKGEEEIFIPAVLDFIVKADEMNSRLYVRLPEGLFSM
jgi:16S rRNA processing protein RimM